MNKVRAIYVGFALVWGYLIFGCAYAVATGHGLFNSIEYGTAGRVENAICALGALAYGVWMAKTYLTPLYRGVRKDEDEA